MSRTKSTQRRDTRRRWVARLWPFLLPRSHGTRKEPSWKWPTAQTVWRCPVRGTCTWLRIRQGISLQTAHSSWRVASTREIRESISALRKIQRDLPRWCSALQCEVCIERELIEQSMGPFFGVAVLAVAAVLILEKVVLMTVRYRQR